MKTITLLCACLLTACADNATMMRAQDRLYRAEARTANNPGSFSDAWNYQMMCYFLGVPPRVRIGGGANPYLQGRY